MRDAIEGATPETIFTGESELAMQMRSLDWSQTPLGAVETWSDSFKAAVKILLAALDAAPQPPKTSLDCTAIEVLRQVAQADAFRVRLTNALRPLTDANEIQAVAARLLGESLGANRVIYIEVLPGGKEVIVHTNYTNGVAALSGLYHLDDFGRDLTDDHWDGKAAIVPDVANGSKYTAEEKVKYHSIEIAAHIDVPLIKNDHFVALLAVHQTTPRLWTQAEVRQVEETAEQTWAAVERARAEAALRESEVKYRTLFETITQGFCLCEMLFDEQGNPIDYRILEVNPSFEVMTGLHDVIGKTARELVPNLEAHWFEVYGTVVQTGNPIRFENQSIAMNRWFDANAFRVGGLDSHQFAILFTDVSDRKRAEEVLRRNAALNKFRIALADALRPLANPPEIQATASRVLGEYLGANRVAYFEVRGADYVVDQDYVNGAIALTGHYPIDSFGPKLLAAYRAGHTVCTPDVKADPNLSPEQQAAYAAIQIGAYIGMPLVKGGEFVAGLAVHSLKPRAWTQEEISLAEEVAEHTWAAVERARAETALRDSENRFRMAIESAQLGTWDWNLTTNQLLWDAGCKAMFGLPPEAESSIEVFFAGLHPDDRERLEQVVQWTLNPASSGKYDTEYRTIGIQDGIERWVAARGQVYFDAADRPQRFVGTVLNITRQKRIEAEREQLLVREQAAREAADRANRIKDEFLAVLSHELRSPLNPILGWSKLLQQGKLNAAKTITALESIERNAQLQVQLIDDLLDISRILRGKLSLNVTPVDLSFVMTAALETVRLAAEAKAIHIQTTALPNVGIVLGDAGRLQQVVWNLLSNAVKFTPAGGRVTVALTSTGDLAQIQVCDTGKGIRESFLPYVFEHFCQEDGATTRKFGGLGLGLAIVRQIVELHGGTVTVESPGEAQGATFTVRIPLAPQSQILPPSNPSSHSAGNLSSIHALVADDDADSREFVAFVLEQAGAIVTTVASGAEAVKAIAQAVPHILVCDIGMPEMDGYMLLRYLRSLSPEQGGHVPAIALTAYAGEVDRQQALTAGFQYHLAKPVDPEAVVAIVAALVSA